MGGAAVRRRGKQAAAAASCWVARYRPGGPPGECRKARASGVPLELLEHLSYLVDVDVRVLLEHVLGDGESSLRVGLDGALQNGHLVDGLAGAHHLLLVLVELVHLSELHHALNGLLPSLGALVDLQRQLGVDTLDHIAELLRAFQLVAIDPVLHVVLSALCEDWTTELDALMLVQASLVKERLEVNDDRLWLAGDLLLLLEPLDGLRVSQQRAWGVGRDQRSLLVVLRQ